MQEEVNFRRAVVEREDARATLHSIATGTLAAALLLSPGCSRETPSTSVPADASDVVEISVRVPAALSVARAIDTLSVAVDPASLGLMEVTAHAGTVIGVETDVFVFAQGQARPVLERRAVGPSADFNVGSTTWNTRHDGVPAPGTKYVVEMQLVLFETDIRPTPTWDPHAGNFRPLWTQTLRQAEE
jgi:hypothetical protein